MKLESFISVISGSAFKPKFFNDQGEGLPLIRVRDVNSGFTGKYYSGAYDDKYLINDGDLLIGMDGDFRCVEWKDGKAVLNQRVCKLIPNDRISKRYLLHFLPSALDEIHRKTTYTTVKHLSVKQIKNIDIDLPSLDTQKCIAQVLTDCETLIAQRKESIALLDELVKSTFLEMFGDRKGDVLKFDQLANKDDKGTFSNGPFGSDLLKSELKSEGVPVVYIRDISTGEYIKKNTVFVTKEKAQQLKNCQVLPEDILITKVGDPPGMAAIYHDNDYEMAIITQDVIRLRLNRKKALPQFIKHWFNSAYGSFVLKKIIVEGTRKRFGLRDLKSLEITVPKIKLQIQFSQIAEKVEETKTLYQSHLTELESLYARLSQDAFKGKLDVSNVVLRKEIVINDSIIVASPNISTTTTTIISRPPKTERYGVGPKPKPDVSVDPIRPGEDDPKEINIDKSFKDSSDDKNLDHLISEILSGPDGVMIMEDPKQEFQEKKTENNDVTLDEYYNIPGDIIKKYSSLENVVEDWEFILKKFFHNKPIDISELQETYYEAFYEKGSDFIFEQWKDFIFKMLKDKRSDLKQRFNKKTGKLELLINETKKTET